MGLLTSALPVATGADPLTAWVASAGAQAKAASGSLPLRLTTADPYAIDVNTGPRLSAIFDPDNVHWWHVNSTTTIVKRRRDTNSGVITTSASITGTATNLSRDPDNNTFWCGTNSARVYEMNWDGTVANLSVTAVASAHWVIRVPGVSGKIWVGQATGTLTELNWPAGTVTGRTIAGVIYAPWGVTWGGVPSILVVVGGTQIKQYRESDLTVLNTWNFGTANRHSLQKITATLGAIHGLYPLTGTSQFVVSDRNIGGADIISSDATPAYVRRVFWQSGDLNGGPLDFLYQHPFMTYSDDSKYVVHMTTHSAGHNASGTSGIAFRIRNAQSQEVYRDKVFTSAATVQAILVPGSLGNHHGEVMADGTNPVKDYRKTRCYYQINGGARTEFTPNAYGLNIAIAANETLRVIIAFNTWEMPPGAEPWVGESSGTQGVTIVYDDPSIVVPTPPDGAIGTTTWETIRDNMRTVIKALLPRRLSNLRYDSTDEQGLNAWATQSPGLELVRKFEILQTGPNSPDSPTIISPTAIERNATATLTIAYPVLETLYGTEKLRELEDVMRDDAAQVHDALFSADNYVTGQSSCWVTIEPPQRVSDQLYLQTFTLRVDYYEAMTL